METERSLEEEPVDSTLEIVRSREEQLLKTLLKKIGSSEFLKRIKEDVEVPSMNHCCQQVLEHLKNSNIFEIAFLHPQGSAKWTEERQLRITGFTNKYVKHGLKFEKEALEVFKAQSNLEVITPSLIVSHIFPWLGFSPDGVIFEGESPVALLEIKCPYTGKEHALDDMLKTCKFLEVSNSIKLKTKHTYYGQVQLGMALLNLPKTHLIVFSSFSKSYLDIVVDFDRAFAEDLIRNISEKCFTCMLHITV